MDEKTIAQFVRQATQGLLENNEEYSRHWPNEDGEMYESAFVGLETTCVNGEPRFFVKLQGDSQNLYEVRIARILP